MVSVVHLQSPGYSTLPRWSLWHHHLKVLGFLHNHKDPCPAKVSVSNPLVRSAFENCEHFFFPLVPANSQKRPNVKNTEDIYLFLPTFLGKMKDLKKHKMHNESIHKICLFWDIVVPLLKAQWEGHIVSASDNPRVKSSVMTKYCPSQPG